MAQRFAIGSLAEARAYLGHRILGTRLTDCTTLVNQTEGRSALDIFGHPDDLKFHSSMTLFSRASVSDVTFRSALDCFFGGAEDSATVRLLATASAGGA